ncbi:MAG: efflux transporter outer membrane subunit [Burkholderiales bacterium]|nr:efflux transporter outer membrane subunit [Burkholderiales bacterium]
MNLPCRLARAKSVRRRANDTLPTVRPTMAVAALGLLLTGCSALKPFGEPETRLPTDYAVRPETEVAALGNPRWWTLIDDPDLPALVETALRNNRDLRRAVARIDEADALLRLNGAALLPQINVEAGATRNRATEVGAVPLPANAPVYRADQRLALTTSYEVDVWGRLRSSREAARANLLASREAADAVAMTLVATVAQTVVSLRAVDLSLALTRKTLASREESLRLIRIRRAEGVGSELEERQAEAAVANLSAQGSLLERSRGLLQNQLALLCGEPATQLAPQRERAMPEAPVPPAGLPSALLEDRPDVRAAMAQMQAARLQTQAVRAARFPLISLTGSLGQQSGELADLLTAPARIWTLAAGLTAPLFDAGRAEARTDQARAQAMQAQATYEATVLTAFREASDALISLEQNRSIETAAAAQRDASAAAAKVSRVRYEGGYSGWLEVLDAERTANAAEQAWVTARQNRIAATIDLLKALGTGWTSR